MIPKFLPQGFCKLLYRFQVVGAESLTGHLSTEQKQVEVDYFLLDFPQIFFIIASCVCKSWSVEYCDSHAVLDNLVSSYLRDMKQNINKPFNSCSDLMSWYVTSVPRENCMKTFYS